MIYILFNLERNNLLYIYHYMMFL